MYKWPLRNLKPLNRSFVDVKATEEVLFIHHLNRIFFTMTINSLSVHNYH